MYMPRKIDQVETESVTVRLPSGIIKSMDAMLTEPNSYYASRTDIILTALREFIAKKKTDNE